MTYFDPNGVHNPSTGTAPPASWGDIVRDDLVWLAGDSTGGNPKPMCRVYNNAGQNIATATFTALTFNSERYDTAGLHSTSSNTSRITIPTGGGGIYHIGASVRFASNSTGARVVRIRRNGSGYIGVQEADASATGDHRMSLACDYFLFEGDYIEVMAFQSSGGVLSVDSESAMSPEFWVHWVGLG